MGNDPGEARAGAEGGARGLRLTTRQRLFTAFAAVAGVFALAFWSQLAGLRRIESRLDELQAHDEEARLTLELENAIDSQFAHQAHFIAGESSRLGEYREARARAVKILAELDRRVDEPEADAWLKEIRDITAQLDHAFEEEVVPAVLKGDPQAKLFHERSSTLVKRVETNIDRMFEFLREEMRRYHAEVRALERSTLRLAFLFLVGTPLLALAGALYLSRSIARPLTVLGEGAARVAGGDLSTRIAIGSADDFGALASKFNAMTGALKEQQERLVRSEKLASVGQLAASIAHELNDPLQVILGYVTLDRDRVRGDVAKHLAAVEREATRCKEIVEGLLQLSRPTLPMALGPVDVRQVADEVASALRVAYGDAMPAVAVHGEGVALAAQSRVQQVLLNLTKNDADAAGAGGQVRIDVSADGDLVEAAVSDSGPGVPPDLRERIFEPFFTSKPAGTGMGLPVVRAVAAALGGDVEVGDSPLGGARFALRIPRASIGDTR